MFSRRIRPAQGHAARWALHPDLEMTCDDVSWNVPALHRSCALAPRTRDRQTITREAVLVLKVTRDAPSIACDKRPAPRPTARPQTSERVCVQRETRWFSVWLRCGCCITCQFLSRK